MLRIQISWHSYRYWKFNALVLVLERLRLSASLPRQVDIIPALWSMEPSNETTTTRSRYQDQQVYGTDDKTTENGASNHRGEACGIDIRLDSEVNATFVNSMTFTSVSAKCDCDECCNNGSMKRSDAQIPQAINAAIQTYKRTKRAEVLVKRSQVRTLIGRSAELKDLAVWEFTMPSLAEPLIEYGNPLVYRVIWIKRLHKSLLLKQIGSGIIGSNSEEEGRRQLDWIENDVVVVSSKDQKAVGYVVEPIQLDNAIDGANNENSCFDLPGPAVLYVAKIPSEVLLYEDNNHVNDDALLNDDAFISNDNTISISFEVIRRICSRAVQAWSTNKIDGNYIRLDRQEQILFRKSITSMLKT